MSNTILVTGCTGLVGHGICNYLLNRGYKIFGTSRNPLISLHKSFTPIRLDLTNPDSISQLKECFNDINTIIHNAALIPQPGLDNTNRYFQINLCGTLKLLELAETCGIEHFIYISSTSVVENVESYNEDKALYSPINEYYSSKIAGETVCRQYNLEGKLKTTILRIRAPYGYLGTKNAVIPRFIDLASHGKNIEVWGSGRREQVFTFVEDIGLGCELAMLNSHGGIFNIVGAETVNMKTLAEKIVYIYRPKDLKIIFSGQFDSQEDQRINVTWEKAKRFLGYIPQNNIDNGLEKVVTMKEKSIFFNYL